MAISLIDSVKSVFTDTVISKFTPLLGESEANTRKALQAAIPTILTQVLHRSVHTEDAGKIYDLSKQSTNNDFFGHMHELNISQGSLTAGSALLSKGGEYAQALLGAHTDSTIKETGRYANIATASASFIVGVASFAAFDAIGRQIAASNLDVNGMVAWLATQRDTIVHSIPQGVQVKEALGISRYPGEGIKTKRNTSMVLVIAAVLILIVLFLVFRSCNNESTTSTTATTAVNTTVADAPVKSSRAGELVTDTLANGTMITADKNGTEEQLIHFLNDESARIDHEHGNWFNFTQVSFDRNSANLLLESETQLKNIVVILNTFPKARIRIGGFSDNTGDSVQNIKLSQQRADNVLAKLKDLGTKHIQLDGAKGYGAAHPIGDNGTEEGRALNRRMAIDVVAK